MGTTRTPDELFVLPIVPSAFNARCTFRRWLDLVDISPVQCCGFLWTQTAEQQDFDKQSERVRLRDLKSGSAFLIGNGAVCAVLRFRQREGFCWIVIDDFIAPRMLKNLLDGVPQLCTVVFGLPGLAVQDFL